MLRLYYRTFPIAVAAISLLFFGCKPQESAPLKTLDLDTALAQRSFAFAFELPDLQDNIISLRSFRGKVLLINFWATWCVPCIEELPALQSLHTKLQDEGFSVLAISVDLPNKRGAVERFVEQKSLTFPVLLDADEEIAKEYGVMEYPTSVLVDANGHLLMVKDPLSKLEMIRITGEREWDSEEFVELMRSFLPQKEPVQQEDSSEGSVSSISE